MATKLRDIDLINNLHIFIHMYSILKVYTYERHKNVRAPLPKKGSNYLSFCKGVSRYHIERQILVYAPKLNKRNVIHFNLSHL